MTAPVNPAARRAAKKPATALDMAAVLMRVARHGLQIVPVALDDWARVIGVDEIDGARVRLVLDGNVIWMGEHATTHCLRVALQEADPNSHPYLRRPAEVVYVGHSMHGRVRVLRREPKTLDFEALLGQ